MQQTKPFSFRRIRSFDEVLSDTFTFLRLHFRYIGKHFLTVVGPVILLAALLRGMLTSTEIDESTYALFTGTATLLEFLPDILTQLITYVYIVLCSDAHGGIPAVESVRTGTRRVFLPILGGNIISVVLTVIGLMFLVVPGVYIGVSLLLISMVIVEEERGVFASVERCFDIVKGYWWPTFGLGLVLLIFAFIGGLVSGIPEALFILASDIFMDNTVLAGISNFIGSCVGNTVSVVITALFNIALALHYYSLVERREAPGLRERVEALEHPEDNASPEIQPS